LLRHSFIHLSGVGEHREAAIWRSGIRTWQDFLDNKSFRHKWLLRLSPLIEESLERLEKRDASFFHSKLPGGQRWRLYDEFKADCAFLDIETTGLFSGESKITVAGLFDGEELKTFVRGRNLDEFVPELNKYSLIVTYGGSCFDLPFIKAEFELDCVSPAHIDLRYVLHRLGYKGGLKAVERRFGLLREGPIARVDGWIAPILWREYRHGSSRALEALIRYNAEDVVNLQSLMEKSYSLSLRQIPIDVPHSKSSENPLRLPDYDPDFLNDFLKKHNIWQNENSATQ